MTIVSSNASKMDSVDPAMLEARKKLLQRAGDASRTGGKGTARRKKRVVHKSQGNDDKKLQGTLKRLGLNTIPNCEEVNMIRDNGTYLSFATPKVQACINANTYVITGPAETKKMTDMPPSEFPMLGPDAIPMLRKLQEGGAAGGEGKEEDDDDDDVPDLVNTNFEDVSKAN
uniref:Nascent polypeptide-associated complex subunit beta n=1 Tax=Chromera velia CCMP2878 TaxID=1169474 RepID=A0A0G4F6Z7_9ALVE|mmetsp:Transcript_12082/g.23315  ORF Transcript_12082/g.23315 Transcript_12082/m.23315 type:complete len:172 (+) Transcript_12082:91-606(+)|eukprot:Cvel_15442.t1-p1 / transcript=Cvel_15442.t1 / gene=Cvel_15442 / organism=Chromera_velia_CCMP2878 / gene_product=Transcription factor BTF3 homolog 4, putative / transcript_product=Transcription factor BTF3 homolog 4, putative / location=Cvel_scaffold1143:8610-9601(-) / protein_length=171 / sequence_SO=supercontig / SO=protein_coding / is_pseudo=false